MSAGTQRIKLTQRFLEHLAAADVPRRFWDSEVPGLFLRVQPSGVKSWNVQVSRLSSHALGKWPKLTDKAARLQAKAFLGQLAEGKVPETLARRRARRTAKIEGRPQTLRELVKLYREHASVKTRSGTEAADRIERVLDRLLDTPLDKVSHARVDDVLVKRQAAGAAPATIAKDLALIKACLAWAVERGDLAGHPLKALKPPRFDNKRVRWLKPEERQRLLDALAARDAEKKAARARTLAGGRAQHADLEPLPADGYCDALEPAVRVSLATGLRRGELLALDWADVNVDAKRLTVRSAYTKSGKTRHIPLNAEAASVLARWHKQTGGKGRVFPHDSVRKAWEALLTQAKIENFHWHDLRHDFASQLVMRGVDLNTVRELLGHASLLMTLRYSHLAPEHLAAAVEVLDQKPSAKGARVIELKGRRRGAR
jgi:integrase